VSKMSEVDMAVKLSGDLNSNKSKGLRPEALLEAYDKYKEFESKGLILNKKMTVIDFSLPSYKRRLFIFDMTKGIARPILDENGYLVAHGKNSGGVIPDQFSNKVGSLMSSLGAYLTGETYVGKYGRSLKLDGLEPTNSNARLRSVVMHGSKYVSDDYVAQQGAIGRSWGCPAIDFKYKDTIIDSIKGKSLLIILR